ncbi:response regulator transcription factor [Novosphingobium flavum]|uniref:Response regulator transcription factor n=1 Tax=Novosphingobium flavum TaxID=1778672 RepID=A0A7X1FQW5_9SPHN|nr:response regulator transcription factor [Novosphingobium flavum]
MRLLVVEDDEVIADYLASGLRALNFDVDHAATGQRAMAALAAGGYEAVVLDRMLPDVGGIDLIGRMRAAAGGVSPPVLMLSALGSVKDRIEGLEAGADDYLAKPFDTGELAARLHAIVRRAALQPVAGAELVVGRLRLDPSSHSARFGEAEARLNRKLFSLLAHLMRHADRLVTRDMLLEHVWGYTFAPTANIVDANLSRLRSGLQAIACDPIETLRGQGYILRADRCT